MRGLDPTRKSARLANYVRVLRKEILRVCHASGVPHPTLMDSSHVELSDGQLGLRTLESIYNYPEGLRQRSSEWSSSIYQLMDEADTTSDN